MKYLSLVSCFVGILINVFIMDYCYKKISNVSDIKRKDFKYYFLIFVASIIIFFVNLYVDLIYRIFLVLTTMFFFYKFIYNDSYSNTFFKTIIIYLCLIVGDFLVSLLTMFIPNIKSTGIEYVSYVKNACTILDSVFMYFLFRNKKFANLVTKLLNYLLSKLKYFVFVILIFAFSSFWIITYKNAFSLNISTFLMSFCLIMFFIFLCIAMIYQYFKNKTAEKEQKQLLELMEEYENLLETGRENRHEMLNNLIVLKTEKNKASEKYEELLDDIIRQYQSKKSTNYSSLYKLPSGIKGIVYYKMANIKENEITFTSVISEEMYKLFDEMDTKLYYKVCKITGILIDNAIEASTMSDDKLLLVDIYKEKGLINIYIENTFEGTVDINLINKKGFSTKGKNRGLGLHIVSTILRENDNLSLEQRVVNNKFVSILKIKL